MRKRGFVLITMAVAAIALIGMLGLAVDVGRMFIAKNETQNYCDSAALAAALALDGTTAGVTSAKDAVANSANVWNLNTTTVKNPVVTFATSLAGPFVASPSPADGYNVARVSATVPMQLYFIPVLVAQTTTNVASSATAAQVALTSVPRGLAPYTAVSTNTTGPNFGMVVGNSYSIHWPQFNSNRLNCPQIPNDCFNSPPCADDTAASKAAVVANWGESNSGFWGSNSNSVITQEVLDLIQIQQLAVGTNINPILTNGTKQSEAKILDQRVSQDVNTTGDITVADYLAGAHNGRRLLAVPVVDPTDPSTTTVIGYGVFLLLANGPGTSTYYKSITDGNKPYCALYAGTLNIGSTGPGTGGTTGGSRVKLVQ